MNQKERRNSMDYSRREHGSGSEGLREQRSSKSLLIAPVHLRALFCSRLQECCICRPAKALRSSAFTSETAHNSNPSRSQCETL
jgi:hypothetical protein